MRPLRTLRSLAGSAIVALIAIGLVAPAEVAAARPVPKVVVVVGPAGVATDRYRSAGDAAADVARRAGADVVEIASPNATWPAVKRALQDASIVVYLGHGNGWPSRYRPALYPPTQNGLGLNPVAGVDDSAHQYFGEAYLERYVTLAPNAVVVLSHLCYASGLSEPGLPEGTLDEARQRVDNFAAGWIAAGARAVVAEAYLDPAWYVAAVLSGRGSVAAAWRASPTANGHVLRYASERRSGYVDLLDPVHAKGSGFERSLVIRGDLAAADVVAAGLGAPDGAGQVAQPAAPPAPTLASVGATITAPTLTGLPVAGSTRRLTLPIDVAGSDAGALLDGLELSVRWDPLDVAAAKPPAASPTAPPTPSPAASPTPAPTESAGTTGPADSAAPAEVDPFALVAPEVLGEVVDPAAAKATKAGWRIRTVLPETPGLYSLTVRLHDSTAVAFDEASQVLVPRLLVRVVSATSATIVAPATVDATAGSAFELPVAVMNTGNTAWAVPQPVGARPGSTSATVEPVRVIAHWVGLGTEAGAVPSSHPDPPAATDGGDASGTPTDASLRVFREIRPGERVEGTIAVIAPTTTGSWLLLVDVATPETPSLVATGSEPALVRVTVTAPATTPSDPNRS
ncbi:MAG TPA: hypothetical protein VFS32_13250 [Candidatus Limnocylindrales bacterium]|nr:hypothetical protein [Candidatus Limnocylindrales bacterium]